MYRDVYKKCLDRVFEILDIYWGSLSDPIFIQGAELMLGPSLCSKKIKSNPCWFGLDFHLYTKFLSLCQ